MKLLSESSLGHFFLKMKYQLFLAAYATMEYAFKIASFVLLLLLLFLSAWNVLS